VNGATPIYVNPDTDSRLGIALGMKISQVERAIEENPEAKAILVNNPTYYGICSNLKRIVELAHEHGMLVLVDEAHGTHFYFGEDMPLTAMAAGADVLFFEVHPNPDKALCDGPNMLYLKDAKSVFKTCKDIFEIVRK
jgi:arginine/lysine/ornithine decarboxylase